MFVSSSQKRNSISDRLGTRNQINIKLILVPEAILLLTINAIEEAFVAIALLAFKQKNNHSYTLPR